MQLDRRRTALVALLCALLIAGLVASTLTVTHHLYPQRPVRNLQLRHNEAHYFALHGLQPNKWYELRVNYPATTPTDFDICFVDQCDPEAWTQRKLLNAEKLVFSTDERGHVRQSSRLPDADDPYVVAVRARRVGVTDDPELAEAPVMYTVVLEEQILPQIPASSLRLVVVLAVLLLVVFLIVVPRFLRWIPARTD